MDIVTLVVNKFAYLCGGIANVNDDTINKKGRYFIAVTNNDATDSSSELSCKNQPKPLAGSTTIQLQNPMDEHDDVVGWVASPSTAMDIRGRNYLKDRIKIPSPASLYELVEVDAVDSEKVFLDVGQKYDLSEINKSQIISQNQKQSKSSVRDNGTRIQAEKTWLAPNVLVISFALPIVAPKIGKKTSERGYIVTGYYQMREETRDILKIITNPKYNDAEKLKQLGLLINKDKAQSERINAVRLWEKFCKTAPNDPEMQKRLKFIPRGDNLREIGVASWICKYNGKPMLIKRPGVTSFIFSHSKGDRMEIDINMHPLPFMFKQAMNTLNVSYFHQLFMTFGFIIEGREEDELPEVLLGNPLQLPCIKQENVSKAEMVFGKPNE